MFGKYSSVLALHFVCTAIILKCLSVILPCCVTSLFTSLGSFILFIIIATATFRLTVKKHLNDKLPPENRAVLITGCDTGFGHMLAKRLDSQGFHVFASCRNPSGSGAKALSESCSKRLQILHLDVTNDESVKKALEFVKENLGSSELWALVNNAGIFKSFGVEFTTIDDFKQNLEVNALGPVRVTKFFLPLLRQSRGRVINMTSIAGRIPGAHMNAYIMSKYALAGFNDCIRQELDVWGIRVISIEPEMYRTGLIEFETLSRFMDSSFQAIDDDIKTDYGEKYTTDLKRYIEKNLQIGSTKLSKVVDAMEDAVSLEHPEIIYRPCRNYFVKYLLDFYEAIPHCMKDIVVKIFKFITRFPLPALANNFS